MENNLEILVVDVAGVRLDAYVADKTQLSRSAAQELIKEHKILVDEKPAKASLKLEVGSTLFIYHPEVVSADIVPEALPIEIVYEDKDLVVINKAKGMVVHPAPGHYTGTLVNALMHHCDHLSGINGVMRPGIVHRIDKDTSGLLVVAKNDIAHTVLSAQLEAHSMIRSYVALVFGNVKEDALTIDAPIGRHPIDRKKMAVTDKNAKSARTHITVLNRFFYKNQWFSYVKAQLETGRTHQIRVHMAHIKHPLVGDVIYGAGKKQPWQTGGQMLHAKELGLVHPNGEEIYFSSELPEYFERILKVLGD